MIMCYDPPFELTGILFTLKPHLLGFLFLDQDDGFGNLVQTPRALMPYTYYMTLEDFH